MHRFKSELNVEIFFNKKKFFRLINLISYSTHPSRLPHFYDILIAPGIRINFNAGSYYIKSR